MFTTIIQRSALALACLTALGILVHDTKFDQALALSLPIAAATIGVSMHAIDGGTSHTHIERGGGLSRFALGMPRIQPRDDTRRYMVSKYLNRSTNPFGDSAFLWPSV